MSLNDGTLVERSLAGDRNAFSALVARHLPWVCAVLAAHIEAEYIEDLASTVFQRAWRSLGSLRDRDRFAANLFELLQRELAAMRAALPQSWRIPQPPHADEWMEPETQMQMAFLSLGSEDRALLAMIQEARIGYDSASSIFGLSRSQFERRLLSTRKRFFHALQQRKEGAR
ncbi:MAG: hypothetical protein EA402_07960 [Planctomycetota bacterium]|nr:MAG: hypothetical protein EA402_07960 [Planctomycetota bacterium]